MLGSTSSARANLLKQVGLVPHRCIAPNIDEIQKPFEKPKDYVVRIAKEKADKLVINDREHLITADTVINLGTQIFHKTVERDIAKSYLEKISGRRHKVLSSICIKHKEQFFWGVEETIVKARRISEKEIDAYLSSDEWVNKAGAYAIQGVALKFFPVILGCFSNIVGLPLNLLFRKLHASGFLKE